MSSGLRATADVIERATGLKVWACKAVNRGAAHRVFEVNGEWVFRFPRGEPSRDHVARDRDEKRLHFLAAFAKRSPVAVPMPAYVTEHFVGYRKIAGTRCTRRGSGHRLRHRVPGHAARL